ncbi:MAG: PRC-barrel domain-containing protein [Trueperaceae bacterium]|nr:PRC-barrel domain-containing protein [Trueperaceae bacterium]
MRKIQITSVIVGLVAALAVAPKAILADERDNSVQRGQSVQHGQMDQPGVSTNNTPIQQISDEQWDRKPFSCKRAEKVIGSKVENASGNDLGHIKDLAIDPSSGRVVYGVLSFGGFLGLGEKYFAIPWKSLDRNADGDYVLNVSEERLKNAEGFASDNWPRMANRQWAEATHSYYGQRPYWHDQQQVNNTQGSRSVTSGSQSSTAQQDANRTTPSGVGNGIEPGTNSPAGPYADREPGIDSSTNQGVGNQPGIQTVDTGASDDQVPAGQDSMSGDDRQLAQGETGRAEFKSSVGMTERGQQGQGLQHGMHAAATIVKASDLVGETVDNRQKEALGSVKDLVIDSNNGRINSIVLARGGVLGIGEELYAIPWQKLTVQTQVDDDGRPSDVDDVIVNVDKETLKNAPSFTAEAWPTDDEPTYFVTVYRFYAVPQYWD